MFQFQSKLIITHFKIYKLSLKTTCYLIFVFLFYFEQSGLEPWLGTLGSTTWLIRRLYFHFKVAFCLGLSSEWMLMQNIAPVRKWLDFHTGDMHFHTNSFAQRLVLPQKQKSTIIHPWDGSGSLWLWTSSRQMEMVAVVIWLWWFVITLTGANLGFPTRKEQWEAVPSSNCVREDVDLSWPNLSKVEGLSTDRHGVILAGEVHFATFPICFNTFWEVHHPIWGFSLCSGIAIAIAVSMKGAAKPKGS